MTYAAPHIIEAARRFIAAMPESIPGSLERTALFEVCCVLAVGFSLNDADAWALLTEWNQAHSQPPWPDDLLERALARAKGEGRLPGYLLHTVETPTETNR
jgi:hypothetical protein